MAEGFVLNISKEMLQRLDAADKKIVQIGESAEKAMKKINEAFGKKLTGVEDFIKQLNDIQQQLSKKDLKVNVDLALKNGALDSLKKQIEALGITIPVGVTATGTGGGNSAGAIPNGLNEALSQIATTIESITDKMRLLNQEYQAKVKAQQANEPKNIALIEKEKKEYEKLLKTISQLEKTKQKADRDIVKHGINSAIGKRADVVSQQTDQQIQHANQRKLELERKYGTDLLQIRQANNVKELDEVRRQGNEEIKEYERVRSKILEINKTLYDNNKTLKNTKDPNLQAQINNQNQALLNERSKLATRQLELERKHGNSLLSVQTKIGQKEVEFERKKQQDKIREVQQALRRRQDIERRWAQRNARLTEQKRNTAEGALSFSQNEAKTIGQKLQAIKYLQNAQKSLDVTTSQGRSKFNELNREIKKTEKELRRCGVQMNNFQEKSRHLFDITGQLGRALSLMFSVSQITQYVSKMVNVRKEMELQQRSLQVLLQNKDKANELWNQTLDLAVKSPFRVKELVTYTKQLAAYRIESDKLFETNKMLADVSAGLGVDMQRLILAFGQVKSASFLRGCLGKGTPIRLYNEDIKEVQNIVVGDVIMGDDNTPRNVKEIIYGKEQMYIVKQGAFGDDYRVNENHILTLKDNITATIVDVYVKGYLKDKERYNGVKISADGNIIDYPIELIKDNIDEYFGFVIDGNKRFLLGDGTITHNTELRQFTEAGIPMLEELSKYFSEIYGKSVSVAEVFDMISKRMVTFTDVEKVFQRMTGAGGVFFNMQEELSQTTAGMISNLQDSIDLMLNEVGKKNQGLINNVIKAARYLVDNWETVGKVMKGALLILLMYKAATMDISKITNGIKKSWDDIKFLFSQLNNNPLEFFQTFKSNIIMTALTAIIALVIKAVREHNKYKRAIEEVNKAHEKFRKSVSDVEIGFSEMFRNGNDNIDEYRDKLQELIGIAKQSYNIEIDFKVNELDSIDKVSRKFDDLKEKILSFNQISLEFSLDFVERDDRGWEWFQDYLSTDINQLSESQKSISRLFYEMRTNMSSALKEYYKYKKTADDFVPDEIFESFSSQDLDTETSYDFFKRNVQAINNLLNKVVESAGYTSSDELQIAIDNDYLSQTKYEGISNILKQYGIEFKTQDELIGFINNLIYKYDDYESKLDEATKELTAFYQKTNDDISLLVTELNKNENLTPDELNKRLSEYIYNAIKNVATTKELDPLVLDEMLSQAEKYYKEQEQFGFELDLLPKIKPVESLDLKAWQKAYNEEVDEILNTLTSKEDKAIFLPLKIQTDIQGVATTQDKQLATINEAIDIAQKELDRIEKQKTNLDAKLNSGEITKKQYDDLYTANIEKRKKLIEQLTQLRDLLGGDDEKEKSKKKNKTLKESINDDISILKSAYDKFQELNENFSSAESFEKVKQAYGKAVGEISGLTIKQSADIGNATEIITESIENYDNALVGFTKAHESFRAEAYDLGDSAITIGYGSTNKMFPDEGIVMGATITEEKAEELLRKTLDNRNDNLKKVIEEKSQELGIEINQSMYNALIDMGYQGAGTEDFYTNFFDRVLNVDKGAAYISNIAEKIGRVFGEDFEHPFTESFIDAFKASDIEHRIAMMLEASNLTVNGGEISKTLFGGMLKRSQDRRDLAMGSLEYDFTTLEGLKKALESLIPKAASAGEQAMNALLKAISDVDVEIGVRARIKENEKIAKEISDMFSGYEIGLELKDLNIPSNIVKDVFGEYFDNLDIDVSLDEILNKIQQFKSELDKSDIDISSQLNAENVTEESKKILQSELEGNRKRREQLTKDEQKVTEMLNKEYLERLKTYTKYLLNEQHERVKIRMETLRMLQEVENIEEYTPAQRQTITDKIKEEERKKLAQQTWKDFEQSPMYLQLFDDIENMSTDALESVIAKMKDLYNSMLAAGVAASDLKEILNQIDKAEEAIDRRNPFRNFGKNISNVFKGIKEYEKTRKQQEKDLKNKKDEYKNSQLLLASAYNYLSLLKKGSDAYNRQLIIVDALTKQTNNLENEVEDIETELSTTNNNISSIFNSVVEFQQQMQDIDTLVNSAGEGFLQIAEAVGGIPEETKDTVKQLVDLEHSLMNIVSGILRIIYEDKIAGIAQLVDGVVNLVVVTAGLVSGEKKLNREIEKQGRILSNLQRTYDRLNEVLDEAWSTDQLIKYNNELQQNIELQIQAQKAIVEAKKNMKGADEYGSVEWSEYQEALADLEELYKLQEETKNNLFSQLTAGVLDDVLSATESFVDAWLEAYKETGDGLKGLEDNFKEFFQSIVKRQAALMISDTYTKQWQKALQRYAEGGLSTGEINQWANIIENDLPAMSSALETFFSNFDIGILNAEDTLTGLQRGLHQLTESTGTELASYLNSIRFIVMDSNQQLRLLVQANTSAGTRNDDNPMIYQLKVIAQQTSDINALLNSLTAPHPTLSGRGLKVVI